MRLVWVPCFMRVVWNANWILLRRTWEALGKRQISTPIGTLAAVATIIGTIIAFESYRDFPAPQPRPLGTASPSENRAPPIVKNDDYGSSDFVDQVLIPGLITKALDKDDAAQAAHLVTRIPEGKERRDECLRVYSYSIIHQKFDDATTTVNFCWKDEAAREYLERIELEKFKVR